MNILKIKSKKIIALVVLISIIFTMGMPATSVFAETGTEEAQLNGEPYDTLKGAIEAAQNGDVVKLLRDIEIEMISGNSAAALLISNKSITLDGNNNTIKCTLTSGSPASHLIGAQTNANVVIKNLTVDGNKKVKHGIQAYKTGSSIVLNNVTSKNCTGYGVMINGARIEATDLYTEGNDWGGVNASRGSGIKTNPEFIFNSGNLNDNPAIKADNAIEPKPTEDWVKFGENEVGKWQTITSIEDSPYSIIWERKDLTVVTLNTTKASIEVGNKEQLVAKLTPESDSKITWTTSNENVAIVNDKGVVTAISEGVATITATTPKGKTATCEATVIERVPETPVTVTIEPTVDTVNGTDYFNAEEIEEALSNAVKGEEIKIIATDNSKAPVVPSDVFQAATKTKADKIIIETKEDATSFAASFEFNIDKITKPLEVNTKISVKTITDNPIELNDAAKIVGLSLDHDGDFPGPVTITIQLKDETLTPGSTVYIYYMNNGNLELIDNGPLTVAEDKKVSFILSHASDYVISNTPMSAENAAASVNALIQKIGVVKYKKDSYDAIEAAKSAYNGFKKQYSATDAKLIVGGNKIQTAAAMYQKLKQEVDNVISLINKIGAISVTKLNNAQIDATNKAANAYDALSLDQKAAVDDDLKQKLSTARQVVKDYNGVTLQYRINEAEKAIMALPAVNKLKVSNAAAVKAARTAYDSAIKNDVGGIAKSYLSKYSTRLTKSEARITKAKALAGKVKLSKKKYVYNGKAKLPKVTVSGLKNGKDYKVTYKKNVKIGKATAYITGINDCTNLPVRKVSFKIVPAKVKVKTLKRGVNSFTVTVKKQKKSTISGYEIAYSTQKNSGFKKAYTKKINTSVKNLKDGKVYYVKVRAYKIVDGKKYYGSFSTIQDVRTYTYHY